MTAMRLKAWKRRNVMSLSYEDDFFEKRRESYRDMYFAGLAHEAYSSKLVAVFGKSLQTGESVISLDAGDVASLFPDADPKSRTSRRLQDIFAVASDSTRIEIYKAAGALQEAYFRVGESRIIATLFYPERKKKEERIAAYQRELWSRNR